MTTQQRRQGFVAPVKKTTYLTEDIEQMGVKGYCREWISKEDHEAFIREVLKQLHHISKDFADHCIISETLENFSEKVANMIKW